jgi:tetratricopeptide (TPR) repeat protein
VPSIRERRPQVSAELEALVLRCLEKRPADRPQTAEDVLRVLANVPDAGAGYTSGDRTGSVAAPTLPSGRRTRRLVLAAVAVAAVVGTAFGVDGWRSLSRRPAAIPDSARIGVMLMPPVFEPADSLLMRGAIGMLDARLKVDRRMIFVDMAEAARAQGIDQRLVIGSASRDSLQRWLPDLGVHAHVTLSLARAGSGYLLSATARSTAPDSVLYARQLSAASASELPAVTETLVGETSAALGRAFGHIQRPTPDGAFLGIGPDASRNLQAAGELFGRRDYIGAAAKYRSVLRVDSTLPDAWRGLYFSLSNAGVGTDERLRAIAAAFRYRRKIPVEGVRRSVENDYVRATGDWERALGLYQAQQREGLGAGGNNFALLLGNLRRFDDAVQVFARSRDTTGQILTVVDVNYVRALLDLGRVAEAEEAVARMERAQSATHPMVMSARLSLARASRNADTLIAVAHAQAPNAPSVSTRAALLLAARHAQLARGSIGSADEVQQQRVKLMREAGLDGEALNSAIGHVAEKAMLVGDTPELRRELAAVYSPTAFAALPAMDRPWAEAIGGLARLGRLEEARSLSAEADALIPGEFRRVFQIELANARLEIALAEGNAQRALTQARLRDRGACVPCAFPAYARAWDAAGNADSALFYHDRFLDATSTRLTEIDGVHRANSMFRSAELREARGDVAGALQRYREFVEQWRNASPALQARVRDAQARIERLEARRG